MLITIHMKKVCFTHFLNFYTFKKLSYSYKISKTDNLNLLFKYIYLLYTSPLELVPKNLNIGYI